MLGSSTYLPSLNLDKHLNLASAVTSVITSVGLACFPLVFDILVRRFGWRMSLIYLSGLVMQGVVIAALVMPQHVKSDRLKADYSIKRMKKSVFFGYAGRKIQKWRPNNKWHVRFVGKLFTYKCVCIYMTSLFSSFTLITFSVFISDHVVSHGQTSRQGTMILTASGIGNLVTRTLVTITEKWISSKALLLLMISLGLRAVLIIILPSVDSHWFLVVVGLVMGIGWGVHASLFTTLLSQLYDGDFMPMIEGITCVMTALPAYVALPFTGKSILSPIHT